MSTEDPPPGRLDDGEPLDPNALPEWEFPPSAEPDDSPPADPRHTWWIVGVAAAVVVVAMVVGIVLFNAAAPDRARGAGSARAASEQFVRAINAGDGDAAAAISCDVFVDDARAAAESGKDTGIAFTLDAVRADDKHSATAMITEHLSFPNGVTQSSPTNVDVLLSSGRWLMCGQAS